MAVKESSGVTWANLLPAMGDEPTQKNTGTFSSDLIVSSAYVVKAVTDNGFTTEGTYYTPSNFA